MLWVAGLLQFVAIDSLAQEKNTTPELSTSSSTVDSSKESLVYEKVHGQMRFEFDGTGSIVTFAKNRVQTYAGVQQAGRLIFPYDAANSTLAVRMVRVTKHDGKTVDAGQDAIQDMKFRTPGTFYG